MKPRVACLHSFILTRKFMGVRIEHCSQCRGYRIKETRAKGKHTCLGCGKGLTGRQRKWCGVLCLRLMRAHINRTKWARFIKTRDKRTCQVCGWKETPSDRKTFEQERLRLRKTNPRWSRQKIRFAAAAVTEWRFLEAHHIKPLNEGGAEFDVSNGTCLCDKCHDEEHRTRKGTS
jgi:hypothetical protein